KNTALMQMVDGAPVTITVRKGRSSDGVPEKHARIIRKLIPIRDAVRDVLKAQEFDRPWKAGADEAAYRLVELRSRVRTDQLHHRLGLGGRDSPHAGAGFVDGAGSAAWLDGRRHVRMGHEAPTCGRTDRRCAQ